MASTPLGVTTSHPFFVCNPDQVELFSVNQDVPTINALETASCFLGDALEAMGRSEDPCFAAMRCVEFARAIINAVDYGAMEARAAKGGAE